MQALTRARKTTKKIENTTDLDGYDLLTDHEQKLIKDCIKGVVICSRFTTIP